MCLLTTMNRPARPVLCSPRPGWTRGRESRAPARTRLPGAAKPGAACSPEVASVPARFSPCPQLSFTAWTLRTETAAEPQGPWLPRKGGGHGVTYPLFPGVIPPLEVQDQLFPHRLVSARDDRKGTHQSHRAQAFGPSCPGLSASPEVAHGGPTASHQVPGVSLCSQPQSASHPQSGWAEPGSQKREL